MCGHCGKTEHRSYADRADLSVFSQIKMHRLLYTLYIFDWNNINYSAIRFNHFLMPYFSIIKHNFFLTAFQEPQNPVWIRPWLAFPADIGRKPALPAHGSRQRVHAGENRTRRLMKRPTAQHVGARMESDGCAYNCMKLLMFHAWLAKSDIQLCHLWTVNCINSMWIVTFAFLN